ncbi:hypothetical protein DND132_0198 [Pseudodesulfovibrio mercurii]|uniref:Uncharacterized protein n=1 Tax=Pseudodesulfovibrio mercurii TaxID=641491 RepID=F0JDX6_9BACT|nr:hypothetical protein [Pseudodesulfovibrio mercurii]EGB13416.1 hypothetical protein DND132_0198 [Pseudodesulfovibrio mercurii]
MGRGLERFFIDDLNAGKLVPVLERVKKDHTLDLQIRNNEIHVYYRGGKLVGIAPKSSAYSYDVSFDKSYLNDFHLDIPLVPPITNVQTANECVAQFQSMKLAMDYNFSKYKKTEREFQQLISRENSYSSVSNATDYFVVDVEFEKNVGAVTTKFDVMAIKWVSTSGARKLSKGYRPKLAIVEVKYGDSALTGAAGLVDHLEKTCSCLRDQRVAEDIKATILTQFNQKRELGLVLFSKGGNTNEVVALDDRPEFIFLLANHDPASTTLATELASDAFKTAFAELRQYADIRFAISSFMGYGLFEECLLDVNEFKSTLARQSA